MEDIAAVEVLPQPPRLIGRLTRVWLCWRGEPEGLLRDHEAWAEAMLAWWRAQYIGRVNFDDVVHVLSRSRESAAAESCG